MFKGLVSIMHAPSGLQLLDCPGLVCVALLWPCDWLATIPVPSVIAKLHGPVNTTQCCNIQSLASALSHFQQDKTSLETIQWQRIPFQSHISVEEGFEVRVNGVRQSENSWSGHQRTYVRRHLWDQLLRENVNCWNRSHRTVSYTHSEDINNRARWVQ